MHIFRRWPAAEIADWERIAPGPADPPEARVALASPPFAAEGCAEAIASWAASTTPGTWVEIQLRAIYGERPTGWYRIASWDSALAESRRSSFDAQRDADGRVATDTLLLNAPPDALQARALLCAAPGVGELPALESLAVCGTGEASDKVTRWQGDRATNSHLVTLSPGQPVIELPHYRSQYTYEGGAGWCSPTCLSMALAYWHGRTADPRLAPFAAASCVPELAVPMVYDPLYEGAGNWPMNTAYAASLGLVAYVTRLHSLGQLARWAAAGVPLVASLAWKPGELEGAPIEKSAGHLILITGVDGERIYVADPAAAHAEEVARSYRAEQLYARWQANSDGTVYIIHPPTWAVPAPGPGDAWG
jgi:hypothetical protein